MIEQGIVQKLRVVKKATKFEGFYLKDRIDRRQVVLPLSEVEGEVDLGDEIDVFVYRTDDDELRATMKTPKILKGQLKELEVVDVVTFGAFLDWGLSKDLLLPTKQQMGRVRKGQKCLVALYENNKDRLCATMDLYHTLEDRSDYKAGDEVQGVVYEMKDDMGIFVAVEDRYHGLIPKHEIFRDYKIGERLTLRVTKVREDGKLNLSTRKKAYEQMDSDTALIVKELDQHAGFLSLNDKTDPDIIKQRLGLSKKAFKRAVGRLLKQGMIEFANDGIKKKN